MAAASAAKRRARRGGRWGGRGGRWLSAMAAASAAKRQARRTRSWCRTRARWREAEDVFGGEEDRFDALADRREVRSAPGLVLAARAVNGGVEHLEVGLELAPAE